MKFEGTNPFASAISDQKQSPVAFRPNKFWTRPTENSFFFTIEDKITEFLEAEDIVFCCPDDFKTQLKANSSI